MAHPAQPPRSAEGESSASKIFSRGSYPEYLRISSILRKETDEFIHAPGAADVVPDAMHQKGAGHRAQQQQGQVFARAQARQQQKVAHSDPRSVTGKRRR